MKGLELYADCSPMELSELKVSPHAAPDSASDTPHAAAEAKQRPMPQRRLAWHTSRQTNGLLEAINSLLQAAKRRAWGYLHFQTIRTITFLIAGKLDFSSLNSYVAQPP
jgi:hypothetical protein